MIGEASDKGGQQGIKEKGLKAGYFVLTGTPDAKVVTEDSSQAQIADAIRHNGQMVQDSSVTETVALTEQKQLYAQATEHQATGYGAAGTGLLGRVHTAGEGLLPTKVAGANRASVYADMACDAVGLSAAAQVGKMALDIIKDYKNPFAHGSAKTFDQLIAEGGKTSKSEKRTAPSGKKGSIFTGPFNEKAALPGRAKGINSFMQGEDRVKGVKTTEKTTATLSNKLQQAMSVKMLSKLQLGNAKAAEAKVGAKIAKAQQLGISPMALNHDRLASGPKFVEPKEDIVEEGSTSWV